MSLIPEVPVVLLAELFSRHGVEVEVTNRGVLLRREADGKTYRLAPTDDGFACGSALQRACRIFDIEAFDLVYGE